MRVLSWAAAAVMCVTVSSMARAEEEPPFRPFTAAYAVAGIGTPVGLVGLEVARHVAPSWEIAGGVGLGLSASKNVDVTDAFQWAVMPRYRFGGLNQSGTIGVGLSGGNYSYVQESLCGTQEGFPGCNTQNWRYTLFANLELSEELFTRTGFGMRLFAGYGRVLVQGDQHCSELNGPASSEGCGGIPSNAFPYTNFPYFGLAIGQAW